MHDDSRYNVRSEAVFEMHRVLSSTRKTYVRTVTKCSSKFTVKRDCCYTSSCFDKQSKTKHCCSGNNTIRILDTVVFSAGRCSFVRAHSGWWKHSSPGYFQYSDRSFYLLRAMKITISWEQSIIILSYQSISEIVRIAAFLRRLLIHFSRGFRNLLDLTHTWNLFFPFSRCPIRWFVL